MVYVKARARVKCLNALCSIPALLQIHLLCQGVCFALHLSSWSLWLQGIFCVQEMTGHGTQCSALVHKAVVGQRLDLMIIKVFSNLIDSVILCPVIHYCLLYSTVTYFD